MEQSPRTRETRQRRLVYETVRKSHSHPTADAIFERVRKAMPKISLGTVYRNLAVLKSEGMIREIAGPDRKAHYEADLSTHAHFICTECESIMDVDGCPEVQWEGLKDLVGCEIFVQSTEFTGRCPSCARRHRSETAS